MDYNERKAEEAIIKLFQYAQKTGALYIDGKKAASNGFVTISKTVSKEEKGVKA